MRIICFVVLILLLSGCRLALDIDIAVDSGAGGTLAVSVTTDGNLEQSSAAAGVDPLGRLVERVRAQSGPWQVADVEAEDGGRTVTLTAGFADPEEFALRYAELQGSLDAPEARLLGPMSLVRDPETGVMTVEGELPLVVTEVAAADLGTDVAALTQQLSGAVSSTLTVRTPGPLVQQTGAAEVQVDGVAVSEPYPEAPAQVVHRAVPGEVAPVRAVFEPGGADLAQLLLIGGVAVVALLAIAGGVVAQRRR